MGSPLTAIDLFAGAGGLTRGLHDAGWETTMAVEFDPSIRGTYTKSFPDVDFVLGDISDMTFRHLNGTVNLVAGGPPCQPFSVAGHQKASFDPRDGIPHFIRAVEEIRPNFFLMENVAGLAGTRHRDYLAKVEQEFRELGYKVFKDVLDAADYGVPQHRRRLFLIGSRDGKFRFPDPTHGPGRPLAYERAGTAINSAARDIPNTSIVTYAKNPILRPQPFDGMLVNGGGRPINLSEPSQTIPASAGGNRTHIVDELGILEDYHEYLISGGAPRPGRVEGVRRLTVAESAALQSFPDCHRFIGKQSSRYRQVGNAVPPKLAEVVGREILRQLAGYSDKVGLEEEATEHSVSYATA